MCPFDYAQDNYLLYEIIGGEGGIRTHGDLATTTVFETVLFNRSSTSPYDYLTIYRYTSFIFLTGTKLVISNAFEITRVPGFNCLYIVL